MNIEFYVPDKKIRTVFGALFYNGERKKMNVPKVGTFCRVCEHKD